MHILTISNPTANTTLRQACRPVTQEDMDSGLVAQIVESLRQHLEHYGNGVGLSAPQIGHNIQIAVIYCRPTEAFPSMTNFKAVLINPEVEERSDEMFDGYEGCLSIADPVTHKPTHRHKVSRHTWIRISYIDENNILDDDVLLEGITAVVAQHEIDHLMGILIDDVCIPGETITQAEYLDRKATGEQMTL